MSTQQQIHIIDLGEGLYYFQHTFLASIRSIERKGKIVTLEFIDGSTKELTEAQSHKMLVDLKIEVPLVQPATILPGPGRPQ